MLDEPVEHAKLIQVCLHNGIACLHHGRLGFLLAVGMSDVANGISIIILSEFYINEKYIMHTDTVFSGNFFAQAYMPSRAVCMIVIMLTVFIIGIIIQVNNHT